ncbi:MAG: DHH family phosphoesterase [Nitrospirae bacterium]|nr:DHH family phosphoesterase [Nitrospirota bacterium]
MNREWILKKTNPEYINYLSKTASVSPVFAQILINRGLKTPAEVADFLNPAISALSDPFALPGITTAVERIRDALSRKERILIHGDYDTDGLTATAIMVQTLRMLGVDTHYFIPERIQHGYGFNPASVRLAKELGVSLIITVDCGITSFEAATNAKQEGIDVIITDHHEPVRKGIGDWGLGISRGEDDSSRPITPTPYLLPEAIVIINPKLSTSNSQLSTLSGAGVAFKFAQALASEFGIRNCYLT